LGPARRARRPRRGSARPDAKLVRTEEGKSIKKTLWALNENPWNLTGLEHDKVAQVQRANGPLYSAYLLKESLAGILGRHQLHVAGTKLHDRIAWAARSRVLRSLPSSAARRSPGPDRVGDVRALS